MHRLVALTLDWPRATTAALVAITLCALAGTARLTTEFGYRPLLGGEHQSIRTLETFVDTYSGGFPLFIVWECGPGHRCEHALDETSLEMAHSLANELKHTKGVWRVDSPATSSLVTSDEAGLASRTLLEQGAPAEDLVDLQKTALADPLWTGNLVSSDGSVGAVTLQLRDSQSRTMEAVVAATQAALTPFEAAGFSYSLAGHPIESVIAGKDLATSTNRLTPVTATLVALVLLFLTRSVRTVAATMATMGLGLVWTFGALGWLGWPQDSVLQVLAPLILIIGVCDAVHLVSAFASQLDASAPRSAVVKAAEEVGGACILTTLTTCGAFLSFLLSDLETFTHFGVISAIGVAACLALTFTALPLFLISFDARREDAARIDFTSGTWRLALQAFSRTASNRRTSILALSVTILVVGGWSTSTQLRVDTDANEMWGDESRVTKWIEFVDSRLRGLDSLEIDIDLGSRWQVESTETQIALSRFISFLQGIPSLGTATSVQDLIRAANRAVHDGDDGMMKLGATSSANAELLELIMFSDANLLGQFLSLDRSNLRISVEGVSDTAEGRGIALERIRQFVKLHLPGDWRVTLTGPFQLEHQWATDIQQLQLRSFAGAFVIVFAMVSVFLRSVSLGAVAMLPALLPVVAILGLMGIAGIKLDVGRVMIAAIVLGIAIDDSIHVLTRYRTFRAAGMPRSNAIDESIMAVGRAVIVTSFALALGFLSLLMSAWQSISSFGFFVSTAIVVAMLATLLVVPAVVHTADSGGLDE